MVLADILGSQVDDALIFGKTFDRLAAAPEGAVFPVDNQIRSSACIPGNPVTQAVTYLVERAVRVRLVRKRENGLGVTTTADKRGELQKLALQYQEQEFSVMKWKLEPPYKAGHVLFAPRCPLRTIREYTASYSWQMLSAGNACAFL